MGAIAASEKSITKAVALLQEDLVAAEAGGAGAVASSCKLPRGVKRPFPVDRDPARMQAILK